MIAIPSAILMRNVHQFKVLEVSLNSFSKDPLEDLIVLCEDTCLLQDSVIFASKSSYGMPSGLEKSAQPVANTNSLLQRLLSVTLDCLFCFE